MKFKIHFTHPEGTEDFFIVCGDDIESIQEQIEINVQMLKAKDFEVEEIT